MRILAIFSLLTIGLTFSANAEDVEKPSLFKGLNDLIFDAPQKKTKPYPLRLNGTNLSAIERDVENSNPKASDSTMTICVKTTPNDHEPLMNRIGRAARITANAADKSIEQLSFQPHFSGLKGPKLTIMRRDLERATLTNQGSSAEIRHNTVIDETSNSACDKSIQMSWDLELNHHIDLFDSDESPLVRSDIVLNNRVHFGGYFLGTASSGQRLFNNLADDQNLLSINRPDPIRQDAYGFASMKTSLNRLMLSGFATPADNLYVSGHAGYLEEKFFGFGGELLYRPHDSALSIGGEIWRTTKRLPYLGNIFALDKNNKQTSALLNINYDIPQLPYSLGLSAGRFLDGDNGIEARVAYQPAQSWQIAGFATLSNEDDTRTNKTDKTNIFAGVKITMPLGRIKHLPTGSRQTFTLAPFARDKGQRIDNPYPLYDLTNQWQGKELYEYWNHIAK